MDILGKKKEQYDGEFVLNNQETAKNFSHVSKHWYDQCITYDQAMDKIADEQRMIHDIRGPLSDWQPAVVDRQCVLEYKDGRTFAPSQHALNHLAVNGHISTGYMRSLGRDKKHATKDEVLFKRDEQDADLMAYTLEKTLFRSDRVDQDKDRLFRTWSDGTLRAMLSDQYAIINNEWIMNIVRETVPAGLLSHWRGDADNIYGNVLIPDSIREEDDSDYGGMLSIGNSEIGMRRLSSQPSVFRAICMNGCIWDQEKGNAIRQMHKGEIDLALLKEMIQDNLKHQIPLIGRGIDLLLTLRDYKVNGAAPMSHVIAQTARDYKLTKRQATGVMQAFLVEKDILEDHANSAFGVVNAVTRFGQTLDDQDWVKFDQIGGQMANMKLNRWEALVQRAKVMDEKELERAYSTLAL